MIHLKGTPGASGVVFGKILVKNKKQWIVEKSSVADITQECIRLDNARLSAIQTTKELLEECRNKVGEDEAKIFKAHIMILEDNEFYDKVKKRIEKEQVNAQWALKQETDKVVNIFEKMTNDYLKERIQDIKSASELVSKKLLGIEDDTPMYTGQEKIILAADDLTPADTIRFDKAVLGGILTQRGGSTSHTVILSRSLGIPAVTDLRDILSQVKTGDTVIVDGTRGEVVVHPDEKDLLEYQAKKAQHDSFKSLAQHMKGKTAATKDGYYVAVYGNLADSSGCENILSNSGEGVGLFRTEFLYMSKKNYPSENEQFEVYKKVAEEMGEKEVIIRTLDIGGDKQIDYMELPKEDNPFLGYRAIRICLDRKSMFITQLRALLRAGIYGNIKIMLPMIVSVQELRQAKAILEEARVSLEKEGIPYKKDIKLGIMVETPAAAVLAEDLARECDFFSVGTNDLIQYVTACDRLNPQVGYLYNPYNPAVIRLLAGIASAARKAGIQVGVCGEIASDIKLVPLLAAMGFDELSVSAASILEVKYTISKLNMEELRELLKQILLMSSEEMIKSRLIEFNIKL